MHAACLLAQRTQHHAVLCCGVGASCCILSPTIMLRMLLLNAHAAAHATHPTRAAAGAHAAVLPQRTSAPALRSSRTPQDQLHARHPLNSAAPHAMSLTSRRPHDPDLTCRRSPHRRMTSPRNLTPHRPLARPLARRPQPQPSPATASRAASTSSTVDPARDPRTDPCLELPRDPARSAGGGTRWTG